MTASGDKTVVAGTKPAAGIARPAREVPRLLIEDWLPAAAIGVECMRERGSASALAPHTYLHVWWARRPLTVSRAAVLASLLPADFPREVFERLLGFGKPGHELVAARKLMDEGFKVPGGFNCDRAFKHGLRDDDLRRAHDAAKEVWGANITVIDPMAGGGSIPLESARLGFKTIANEYNPVACSVLEATIDYPFRFGVDLAKKARHWAKIWEERITKRLARFYPEHKHVLVHAYIFARTVPCPDTQFHTPLVPDWHLAKPKGEGQRVVAEPIVDEKRGTWGARIRDLGSGAGQLKEAPRPTYGDGKGVSLFTGHLIPADYIKAKAQAGEMKSALYAVAIKTPQGLRFQPPEQRDLEAIVDAEKELARVREQWERDGVIPTELYPEVSSDERPRVYGMPRWSDMFAPRQLLAVGVFVEELRRVRTDIMRSEGAELGEAIVHLLAFVADKFANHNCYSNRWENTRGVVKGKMDRHDFAFKPAFAELAPCESGAGLEWALANVCEAYGEIAKLPRHQSSEAPSIHRGSATSLPQIESNSIAAVVVDPPYTDNVQYSELADFFYVWLKRTQGHRHPDWFSTYLCEHDQEAVVNISRHRDGPRGKRGARDGSVKEAKAKANAFYQRLMTETFTECHRILRDDGVLTVMFTHKKQEAWETLFASLIAAGFRITATWPVKTESEHSLHQARKNAAQSTVILVARKRASGAGVGYFDEAMRSEIRDCARAAAERLKAEGLNPIDQLVGSFGPAIEVYSRHDEVRTDTGEPIRVGRAIDEASDAISKWRIEQLAARGLEGVEPEGQFALLCWDVLGAAEFRFNEAKLLGHAVGMDVEQLLAAGLVTKDGEKVRMAPVKDRRRERALEPDELEKTLFGMVSTPKRRKKGDVRKVHPNDARFVTALDACHALALRFIEAGGGGASIGSAKSLVTQQRYGKDSPVARLMEALVHAAPEAVRFEKGKKSVGARFPEFRAWHAMLGPLFGIGSPEWKEKAPPQGLLFANRVREDDGDEGDADEMEGAGEGPEDGDEDD